MFFSERMLAQGWSGGALGTDMADPGMWTAREADPDHWFRHAIRETALWSRWKAHAHCGNIAGTWPPGLWTGCNHSFKRHSNQFFTNSQRIVWINLGCRDLPPRHTASTILVLLTDGGQYADEEAFSMLSRIMVLYEVYGSHRPEIAGELCTASRSSTQVRSATNTI
jgi:hypothetical protein